MTVAAGRMFRWVCRCIGHLPVTGALSLCLLAQAGAAPAALRTLDDRAAAGCSAVRISRLGHLRLDGIKAGNKASGFVQVHPDGRLSATGDRIAIAGAAAPGVFRIEGPRGAELTLRLRYHEHLPSASAAAVKVTKLLPEIGGELEPSNRSGVRFTINLTSEGPGALGSGMAMLGIGGVFRIDAASPGARRARGILELECVRASKAGGMVNHRGPAAQPHGARRDDHLRRGAAIRQAGGFITRDCPPKGCAGRVQRH